MDVSTVYVSVSRNCCLWGKSNASLIDRYFELSFRDGCSETGLFLAVANLIEQVKSENKIDIFRTIKDLRDYKPTLFNKLVSFILTKLLIDITSWPNLKKNP